MKRITLSLPDETAAALAREARRRRVSMSRVNRELLEAQLGCTNERLELSFIGMATGRDRTTARDAEEILAKEWTDRIDRRG
jgi:hypothetical protein